MNSSAIPMLQRKILKVSMASGEADRKKVLLQESALGNPFEIHICSAVVVNVSSYMHLGFHPH